MQSNFDRTNICIWPIYVKFCFFFLVIYHVYEYCYQSFLFDRTQAWKFHQFIMENILKSFEAQTLFPATFHSQYTCTVFFSLLATWCNPSYLFAFAQECSDLSNPIYTFNSAFGSICSPFSWYPWSVKQWYHPFHAEQNGFLQGFFFFNRSFFWFQCILLKKPSPIRYFARNIEYAHKK